MIELLDGDLLIEASYTTLGWAIRKTLSFSDDVAPYNHIGLIFKMDDARRRYLNYAKDLNLKEDSIGNYYVSEALWHFSVTPFTEYQDAVNGGSSKVTIARYLNFNDQTRDAIITSSLTNIGDEYSILKIICFYLDVTFGTNISANLGPSRMVCSTSVADSYAWYYKFNELKDPRKITPDDIWQHVKANEAWQLVEVERRQ